MNTKQQNLLFFENASMKGLYENIAAWQSQNNKRLLSIEIQKDCDRFCCIAVTNPCEVVIVARNENNAAYDEIYRTPDEINETAGRTSSHTLKVTS